jgi:CRISPR-associated protein Csm2
MAYPPASFQPRPNHNRDARPPAQAINLDEIRFTEPPSPRLFAEVAESAAAAVFSGSGQGERSNKSSQLRRFYDEFVMWHDKIGGDPQRFEEYWPYVCMLKAKVAYSKGRGHVDENFERMLRHLLDATQDVRQLRQAKLFFESFMAFYKVHSPKN